MTMKPLLEEHDQLFHNNAKIPPLAGLLPEIYHHTELSTWAVCATYEKKKNHSENMQRTILIGKRTRVLPLLQVKIGNKSTEKIFP